jgi:5'-nucleotidase
MKLLISNDDGIFALGIKTLADTLALAGHEVIVVCPDRERSATGHGLTLHDPIRAEEVTGIFHHTVRAWSCSGTPADHGANLGTDVLYSGTVSAAMEGTIEGIPSIALSLTSFSYREFQPAANFARDLIAHLEKQPLSEALLLNVNIPPVPAAEIAGVKITRQGLRRYFDTFQKRVDPRGKTYYWLSGEVVQDLEQPEHFHLPPEIETDVQAIKNNYITIVPLQFNMTSAVGVFGLKDCGIEDLQSFKS